MRLKRVEIDNFRAIRHLKWPLDPSLMVLHGNNANGKTSVLDAIAVGLGGLLARSSHITGIKFTNTDCHWGASSSCVALTSTDDISWCHAVRFHEGKISKKQTVSAAAACTPWNRKKMYPCQFSPTMARSAPRSTFPQRRRDFMHEFSRLEALEGALTAKTDFRSTFEWFSAKEHEVLAALRKQGVGQGGYTSTQAFRDFSAVYDATGSMIPGARNPRIEFRPLRFVVTIQSEDGREEDLSLAELSGGYRIVLALAADLARRMAQGNPHLEKPLESEAVVLIDEVDLHLHPSWQQRVLGDLMRTFPNTQFIVSTHSPHVLSTVKPECIVRLDRQDGSIVAGSATSATFGAEAGHVLETEMGVNERPKNEFSEKLEAYFKLIDHDEHDSEPARELRRRLEELSPRDTALDWADGEIRRRQVLKSLGRKP